MTSDQQSGLIFMTGRNCQTYITSAIQSLRRQTDQNFSILFIDDCSDDETAEVAAKILADFFPGRHELVRNRERHGKARNAYDHLPRQAAAFVAILDADDQLVDDTALAELSGAYHRGYDVVWMNYRTDRGRLGNNRALNPLQSPRGQGWRTSHFFSFRKSLFDRIPQTYFKDAQGEWLTAACDFAIAYPILDQTRRYLHIPKIAYQYTETNAQSHHNLDPNAVGLNSQLQQRNAQIVLEKPALHCDRFLAEIPGMLETVLGQHFSQLDQKLNQAVGMIARLEKAVTGAAYIQHAVDTLTVKEQVPLEWLRGVGGWALDVGLLHHIAGVLDKYKNPRVLEFGSGRGSKVLALLCANRGGQLVSIEHDQKWHRHTSDELQKYGLQDHAAVRLCALQDVDFMTIPGRFYDMSWMTETDMFDVVIVDGPPAVTCPMARLPALPCVAEHLSKTGFHVYLDDYERAEEKKIVEIWRAAAPDMHYETLEFGKGVCLITA